MTAARKPLDYLASYPFLPKRIKKNRLNDQIRATTVKLVGEEGGGVHEVPLPEAIAMAKDQGLDLVELDGRSTPPVCRIMDYGKFLYKQNKAEQKQKKLQKQAEVKSVRLGVGTGEHDIQVKAGQARRFLEHKDKVRVFLVMRGRENSHIDLAKEKTMQFAESLKDIALIEEPAKKQGNKIFMLLSPIKK